MAEERSGVVGKVQLVAPFHAREKDGAMNRTLRTTLSSIDFLIDMRWQVPHNCRAYTIAGVI